VDGIREFFLKTRLEGNMKGKKKNIQGAHKESERGDWDGERLQRKSSGTRRGSCSED